MCQEEALDKESVFAVPCSYALIVNDGDAHALTRKSTAVLDALRRIKRIEENNGNIEKAQSLDSQIQKITQGKHIKTSGNT